MEMEMKKSDLIGKWISDPYDAETQKNYGRVSLEFTDDGHLNYTRHLDDRDQKIFLNYKLQGNTLVTDQPSSPSVEKTKISMSGDQLVFEYDRKRSRFLRSA
jgi:hypothetical protein